MKESKVRNPSSKVKPKLTRSRLKELLHYDPETGIFTRKIRTSNNKKIGDVAGAICNTSGYQYLGVDGKRYYASRLAWLYMKGYFPENDIDHINRIKHDNRWNNLRHVSRSCNMRNASIPKDNKSGVVGVHWKKNVGKWLSGIVINKHVVYLGIFVDFTEAVEARWEAEKKYNFPNCNTTSSAYQFLTSTLSTR